MFPDPKPLWQSKVFWANVITLAIAIVAWAQGTFPEAAAILTTVITLLNIALRVVNPPEPVVVTALSKPAARQKYFDKHPEQRPDKS